MVEPRHVSVDFGSTALRAVEFSTSKKGRVTVHAVAEVALSPGAVNFGIVEDVAEVARSLKALWREGGLKSKEVVFAVSTRATIVRRLTLDYHEPAHFRQTLPFQLPDTLLQPDREYEIDAHIMRVWQEAATEAAPPGGGRKKGAEVAGRRKCEALVVATETAAVKTMLEAMKAAGLKPQRADHPGLALTRSAPTEGHGAEILVDVGSQTSELVIRHEGQAKFVLTMTKHGGSEVTRALSQQFGWSLEEAEQAKAALGMSAAMPATHGLGGAAEQVHPAQPVIDQYAANFISEVRNSLDFFLRKTPGVESVDGVILSGGAAQMQGFTDRISSELRIPAVVSAPFATFNMKCPVPDNAPRWAVAAGLATGVN